MGQSLAMLSEISFKDGAAEQSNFDTYQVARIDAGAGRVHVHLVGGEDWNQPLGGVGEPEFLP